MNIPVSALPAKVTKEALVARIASATYDVRPDGRTTVCELTMVNGFTIRGESSAALASEFREDMGRRFAYEKALDQAWAFEGYLLIDAHHKESLATDACRSCAAVKTCGVDCDKSDRTPAADGYVEGNMTAPQDHLKFTLPVGATVGGFLHLGGGQFVGRAEPATDIWRNPARGLGVVPQVWECRIQPGVPMSPVVAVEPCVDPFGDVASQVVICVSSLYPNGGVS